MRGPAHPPLTDRSASVLRSWRSVARNGGRTHLVVTREKVPQTGLGHAFTRASSHVATLVGGPWAFLFAAGVIVVWAVSGPFFGFSEEWQLWVNTGTTIVTFLMVFLIQNTQNRDARALHLKLDELLRATPRARNEVMETEEEDLDEIEREKEIVNRADPAPPAHKRNGKGNGKATGTGTGPPAR